MMSVRVWMAVTLVLAVSVGSSAVFATPTGESISINFGANQPDGVGSQVTGAAGLAGTVNWNNLDGEAGTGATLNMDVASALTPSSATVSWVSNGTWASTGAGEENNTAAPGDDRNLMTGYLDTSDDSVSAVEVTNLDGVFADGYNIAVYIQGGVDGRGGQYTVTTDSKVSTLNLVTEAAFDGTYIPGGLPGNNYLVFAGFTDPEFTITAGATTPADGTRRAPINGIEIVHVPIPEPSSLVLLGLGILGMTGLARRRRR